MKTDLRKLYATDYLAWYEKTLKIARSGDRDALDLESLSEVLEDLVRETKRSGRSFLKNIIVHLLLIQYWRAERDYNYRHWRSEIANFRDELAIDMTKNLRKYLDENLETANSNLKRITV
jgi:hypothetical protein